MGTLVIDRVPLNAAVDALVDDVDSGAAAAALAFFKTGTLGDDDTTIPSGTLIGFIALGATAFGAASASTTPVKSNAVLATSGSYTSSSPGVATHAAIFRDVTDASDLTVANLAMKGDVGATGGTEWVTMDSTTIGTDLDLDDANCKVTIPMKHTLA